MVADRLHQTLWSPLTNGNFQCGNCAQCLNLHVFDTHTGKNVSSNCLSIDPSVYLLSICVYVICCGLNDEPSLSVSLFFSCFNDASWKVRFVSVVIFYIYYWAVYIFKSMGKRVNLFTALPSSLCCLLGYIDYRVLFRCYVHIHSGYFWCTCRPFRFSESFEIKIQFNAINWFCASTEVINGLNLKLWC